MVSIERPHVTSFLRPVLFGSGPRVGLQPSDEYTLVVLALPVADYYRGGLKGVPAMVVEDYDRAAPLGVGGVKVAGNYAADLLPNIAAKKSGYPIVLYLDSKTHSLVEEFSTSNFIAVDKASGTFVTPKSTAVLPSITNKSLQEIAIDEGHPVECRPIHIDEIMQGTFSEIGACGTAVVVTPVNKVVYQQKVEPIGDVEGGGVGPVLKKLYNRIRRIQCGDEVDKFNWLLEI
jgi:branched-chain amino acid aminotransferase